jgi:hypothetical protein
MRSFKHLTPSQIFSFAQEFYPLMPVIYTGFSLFFTKQADRGFATDAVSFLSLFILVTWDIGGGGGHHLLVLW